MPSPRLLALVAFSACTILAARADLAMPSPTRLQDYHAWFDPLNPANGLVAPTLQTPGPSIDTPERLWSNWAQNVPPGDLPGPIVGSTHELYCEVVFLGATGPGWSRFGYRLSGNDHFLSDAPGSLSFGQYHTPVLADLDELDFFVERTDGSRYYGFDKSLNTGPATAGYWGTLLPLASVRGEVEGYLGLPFSVFAFSPDPDALDPEVFVFATRAGFDSIAQPVPEPATFGLIGAVTLVAILGLRRWRSVRR